MKVTMRFEAKDLSQEDVRSFIRSLREWELRTLKSDVVGIYLTTDPQLDVEEVKAIFEGIYPVEVDDNETPPLPILRLGKRGILVEGKLIGYCDEMSLTVAESSEEEIERLQEVQIISLLKMPRD